MAISVENIYETTEAAQLLGIGYATLYRWIKAGKLTPIRIAGRTLIPKSEIDRLNRERNKEKLILVKAARGQKP